MEKDTSNYERSGEEYFLRPIPSNEDIMRKFWDVAGSPCAAWREGGMIIVSEDALVKFAYSLLET